MTLGLLFRPASSKTDWSIVWLLIKVAIGSMPK